jgi:2-polyprenyl-3-methyl-5-hydroxy-6-metoxy-1,4-benzoquinol methylase
MKTRGIVGMLKNRLHREEVYSRSDYWDAKATEYRGHAISMWPNNHLNSFYHREQLCWIARMTPALGGASVLDVGCGTGRNSRYLAERGAQVLGIDFSAKAIEVACELSTGPNPAYRVQSIFDLSDEGLYDVVFCWGVVTVACKNRGALSDAMRRMFCALKPGGRLLLCEPIHKGFLHRVLNLPVREFARVAEEAGFEIRKIENLHFWPMRLILAYFSWPKIITSVGYHLGQSVMALAGNRALGDYKAIHAVKKQ